MKDAWIGATLYIENEKIPVSKLIELRKLADAVYEKDGVIVAKFLNIKRFLHYLKTNFRLEAEIEKAKAICLGEAILIEREIKRLGGEIPVTFYKLQLVPDVYEAPHSLLREIFLNPEEYKGKTVEMPVRVEVKKSSFTISLDALKLMLEQLMKKHELSIREFNELLKKEISPRIDITRRTSSDYMRYYEGPYLVLKAFCEETRILSGTRVCTIEKVKKEGITYIEFSSPMNKQVLEFYFVTWLNRHTKLITRKKR